VFDTTTGERKNAIIEAENYSLILVGEFDVLWV